MAERRHTKNLSLPVAAGILALVMAGCAGTDAKQTGRVDNVPSSPGQTSPEKDVTTKQLPLGGQRLFPEFRLIGFSGAPGSEAFGRLGVGNLADRARDIEKVGKDYGAGRKPQPVFELIATVANASPGEDGSYRTRETDEVIERYLKAARDAKAVLLLGIQPGRADFLPEVRAYEKWLREPDVGVALDPEWAVDPGEVPGETYGYTTGRELDEVATYLADLVHANDLPEKALVFHQVAASVVRGQEDLRPHEGVALIKSVDGIGGPELKIDTWRTLTKDLPPHIHAGFKLFYEEDVENGERLMTPTEVLGLRPEPEYVLYE